MKVYLLKNYRLNKRLVGKGMIINIGTAAAKELVKNGTAMALPDEGMAVLYKNKDRWDKEAEKVLSQRKKKERKQINNDKTLENGDNRGN